MADVAAGKRLLILELLARYGEKTPAELRALDERLDDDGIYITMARMEHDRKWLSSRKSRKTTGRGRGAAPRWYSLTAKGETALRRGKWLRADEGLEPVIT